jgi:hypothetical protein
LEVRSKVTDFVFVTSRLWESDMQLPAEKSARIAHEIPLTMEHGLVFENLLESNRRLRAEIATGIKTERKLREEIGKVLIANQQLRQAGLSDGLTGARSTKLWHLSGTDATEARCLSHSIWPMRIGSNSTTTFTAISPETSVLN